MKDININGNEVEEWIDTIVKSPEESMMVTVSKPHARCCNYNLSSSSLEPIIQRIIKLSNKNVFGKNKKFEALKGIVIEETEDGGIPHYHIVFQRPVNIDYETFKYRLKKIVRLLNDES